MAETLRDLSRKTFTKREGNVTFEEIQTGCLQRQDEALETISGRLAGIENLLRAITYREPMKVRGALSRIQRRLRELEGKRP